MSNSNSKIEKALLNCMSNQHFTLLVLPTDPVEYLSDLMGIEDEDYKEPRFIFAGKPMDHGLIGDYFLSKESTIHLVLPLYGGGPRFRLAAKVFTAVTAPYVTKNVVEKVGGIADEWTEVFTKTQDTIRKVETACKEGRKTYEMFMQLTVLSNDVNGQEERNNGHTYSKDASK
jgi:hypothetical protein